MSVNNAAIKATKAPATNQIATRETVEASIKQRTAIEFLEKADRLYSLPPELLEVALLRKENPEATLKEICKLSPSIYK